MVLIAHRIALDPSNRQRGYFVRGSGTARFASNWALAEWKRQYAACKEDVSLPLPTEAALRRQLNSVKRAELARASARRTRQARFGSRAGVSGCR